MDCCFCNFDERVIRSFEYESKFSFFFFGRKKETGAYLQSKFVERIYNAQKLENEI